MEENPLISVIIPVYRVEKYLDGCVESILAQTYANLEVILVDDGSPDRCGAMCDRWAEKDRRVRVLHKENGGLSSARNAGIEASTGALLTFVDSDDLAAPDLCSTLYELLSRQNADVACCNPAHLAPGAPGEFTRRKEIRVMDREEAIASLWYQRLFPSAWGKLYRRSLFDTVRFTEGLLFEDIDLMHLIFWNARKIAETASCLYGYVHHEDSITTGKFSLRDLDILLIAGKIREFARDKSENLRRAARAYICAASLRIYLNAPKEPEFRQGVSQARELLAQYGRQVMKDPEIRKKNKMALMLYFYFRPCLKPIYKSIDRWR